MEQGAWSWRHAGERMRKRFFSLTLSSLLFALSSVGAMLFTLSFSVEAQQPAKIPRIGFVTATPLPSIAGRIEAFRQGLRDLGYVEGKNILIEYRDGEGKPDRFPEVAAELVRLKVDVIVTGGPTVTRPVKDATSTIPIVMAQDIDPVGSGFIASLARPGGNITGLSTLAPRSAVNNWSC
jgi:ABC-type uncharacterized transport system substrate-binding protein